MSDGLTLNARLHLETTANSQPLDDTRRQVGELGEAGQKAAGDLGAAGKAADALEGELAGVARQAEQTGQKVREAAAGAEELARKSKEAGDAAKGELGEALGGLKNTGGDKALKEVGEAAGDMAGELAGAAGSTRGLTGSMGGLVGTLIGTAGLAVAMGAVNALIQGFSDYQRDMAEGSQLALEGTAALRDELIELGEETRQMTGDLTDLSTAAGISAGESLAAATAYDIQAAAARRAARDIREMTAVQIKDELIASEARSRQLKIDLRGAGPFDLVTQDEEERLATLGERLVVEDQVRFNKGQRRSVSSVVADMKARRSEGKLDTRQLKMLSDYLVQADAVPELQKNYDAELAYQERLRAAAGEPRLAAPTFQSEEIVVTADPDQLKKDRSKGGGRGRAAGQTDEERAIERRLASSADLERAYRMETAALAAQEKAAGGSEAALEALRIEQAGLAVQQRLGVETLDGLTAAEILAADAAIEAAKAAERQAIATEKAQAVAKVTDGLDRQIAATEAYAAALAGGEKALADYELAEAQRQALERAGENLTPAQTEAIKAKTAALMQQKALVASAEDSRALEEELRLTAMTADEREREVRALELRARYLRDGTAMTEAEADARARIAASAEQLARQEAEAIGRMRETIRDGFVESGKLSLDEIGDYAERRLREAVYDALYAEPIEILVTATVKTVGGLVGGLFGGQSGAGQGGGLFSSLGNLLGGNGGGLLSSLFGPGYSLSSVANGLGGLASLGGLAGLGGGVAGGVASGLGSLGALGGAAGVSGAAGGLGGLLGTVGGLLGPIGLIAGLGSMLLGNKKPSNLGAIATFGANGDYTVSGSKRTAETEGAVRGAADAIDAMLDTLKGFGIEADGVIRSIELGQRDTSKIKLANGRQIETPKGDVEALVKAATLALLEAGTFENPQMERLVDQMLAANKSFEDIAETLNGFVAAQAIGEDLKLELLRFTDPRAWTLSVLEKNQQARRDQVEGFADQGFFTDLQLAEIRATLEALESAELADALERLGESAGDAAAALREARPRLQDWLDAFGFTDAAQLNPAEERQLAMAQYERLLEKARAGDADALGKITDAGDRLIGADEAATSSAFDRMTLAAKIQADIAGLIALSNPAAAASLTGGAATVVSGVEPVVAATQEGTAELRVLTAEVAALRRDLAAVMERQVGLPVTAALAGQTDALGRLLEQLNGGNRSTLDELRDLVEIMRQTSAQQAMAAARLTQ